MLSISPSLEMNVSLSSGRTDSFEQLQELLNNKAELEAELASKFGERLKQKASEELYSTKEAYIQAINIDDNVVTLDTSDFVVNMVEDGVESFDMKPGLLSGPKVKVNKQGKKYASVPISKFKQGRYNWRDKQTGRFDKGSNPGGKVEFRIVSENSDPNSWIHPGYAGKHLIERTMEEFVDVINSFVDEKIDLIFK